MIVTGTVNVMWRELLKPAVEIYADSGNRLPLIRREDLDEQGQQAYDAAVGATGEAGSGRDRPSWVRSRRPLGVTAADVAVSANPNAASSADSQTGPDRRRRGHVRRKTRSSRTARIEGGPMGL
ncbi:MAG: hypothetical protein O3B84_06200, partial [Chloroflexi bacterium]|nr:hypothetical protein [Chloroflexota bacterium]